jgi:hypothetical protein
VSRIGKKWIACDSPGCDEEVLVQWAERTGWKLGERADWCRLHAHHPPYSGIDVKERAAAEHVGDT